MAAPERLFLPVDGFEGAPTEAFVLKAAAPRGATATAADDAADAEPTDVAVVVFPGNPGIAGAYTLFLERLREEWEHRAALRRNGSAQFFAVSYAGHVAPPPTTGDKQPPPSTTTTLARFTLEQQIEHKLCFLRQHVLPKTRKELLLVGHSIGAHLALECAKRLQRQAEGQLGIVTPPPIRVAPILLTPFLSSNPPCPRQRAVRRLASLHRVAGAAAQFAGKVIGALPLPQSLHLRLAAWASGADHHAACKGFAGLLAPGVVDNALFLARDEFATLPAGVSGLPLADLEKCGEACVIAGPGDMWFPRAQFEAVKGRFEAVAGGGGGGKGAAGDEGEDDERRSAAVASAPLAAIWDPEVSHLFGCSAQETIAVAAHVARWWEARSRAREAAEVEAVLVPT
jgi:pimeloyl-ACP methyl ester carboxylesterase